MTSGRTILAIKHGALGDIIQCFDGFASLRAGHAGDHIAVLTTPGFAGFFAMMPWFDEVLLDRRASIFNIPELVRVLGVLRRPWNRVYDFQTSGRTRRYLDIGLRKGTEIVGRSNRATHPLPDMTRINNRDRMLATAKHGGCPEVAADLSWLLETEPPKAGKRAVLVPGSSAAKPEKRWPHTHFAKLGCLLAGEGFEVVLVGTKVDREPGDTILAALPEAVDRIGGTSLSGLAAVLASADVVVGGDTGPVFLAARLGTPTLMLMSGHTDPVASAPFGARAAWLREETADAISPEAAMDACKTLLADDSRAARA